MTKNVERTLLSAAVDFDLDLGGMTEESNIGSELALDVQKIPNTRHPWNPTLDTERQGWCTRPQETDPAEC